jgi:dTDP-4-dehydrorhamnose 3,5-epimerase
MKIIPTELPGLCVVEPTVHGDERGFFFEAYQSRKFAELGLPTEFVQDNCSRSAKGILRGLHYQVVQPQDKLVWVNQGEIYDAVVDLREKSPTFGCWYGVILSAQNFRRLFVPKGFAHGFLVLSESADVSYKVTDYWCPAGERCLRWDDPAVGIAWPLMDGVKPQLNSRDAGAPCLAEAETYPHL